MYEKFNPIALRTAKTLRSFGHSECNRVKQKSFAVYNSFQQILELFETCVSCHVVSDESVKDGLSIFRRSNWTVGRLAGEAAVLLSRGSQLFKCMHSFG